MYDYNESIEESRIISNRLTLQTGPKDLVLPAENEEEEPCKNINQDNFRKKSGLFCVIAGLEHSGTTIISTLIMNAPNLYGAFELGFLLANNPQDFGNSKGKVPKFFRNAITTPVEKHMWGLSPENKDDLLQSECFAEMYSKLRKHSPIYKSLNTSWIVDKTPAYYKKLYSIMEKTPGVPFIVTQKEEHLIRESYEKRNHPSTFIEDKLQVIQSELNKAKSAFPDRLFVVNYTEFTHNPNRTMNELFGYLGLRWDPSYLNNNAFNEKGKLFGREPVPSFNSTRSGCKDCVSNPYGKRKKRFL